MDDGALERLRLQQGALAERIGRLRATDLDEIEAINSQTVEFLNVISGLCGSEFEKSHVDAVDIIGVDLLLQLREKAGQIDMGGRSFCYGIGMEGIAPLSADTTKQLHKEQPSDHTVSASHIQAIQQPAPSRAEAPQPQTRSDLRQIPIGKIFEIEFLMRRIPPERTEELRGKYEGYVHGLMNAISKQLGFEDAAIADKERFAAAMRNVDERQLFEFLGAVFYGHFKASFEDNVTLTDSIQTNRFNCVTSSIMLADVLLRLGKTVAFVNPPDHMLLKGEKWAFETTAREGVPATYPVEMLDKLYPRRLEGGIELLVANQTTALAGTLYINGLLNHAMFYVDEALKLIPMDYVAWNCKGAILAGMGKYGEALKAENKALEIEPGYATAWRNKGLFLALQNRPDEALQAADRSLELNPNDPQAWRNRALALTLKGNNDAAISSVDRSLELDPNDVKALHLKAMILEKTGDKEEAGACLKAEDEAKKRPRPKVNVNDL